MRECRWPGCQLTEAIFSDLHGRFQHLSLSAHVPICHFNRAGKKLPLNSLAQVLGVQFSHGTTCRVAFAGEARLPAGE